VLPVHTTKPSNITKTAVIFDFMSASCLFSGFDGLDDAGQRTVDMKYPGEAIIDLRSR
jgi:hypothetical protein